MKRLMGLNISFLTTFESWNMKGNYRKWHNTTTKDKIEWIGLWDARWRMLELLWKECRWTLRQGIKSFMNHHVEPSWRTPLNKRMIKRKEKEVENTRWILVKILDRSPWLHNCESLELRERKMSTWNQEYVWWTTPE